MKRALSPTEIRSRYQRNRSLGRYRRSNVQGFSLCVKEIRIQEDIHGSHI
jgi:hypothetical protein